MTNKSILLSAVTMNDFSIGLKFYDPIDDKIIIWKEDKSYKPYCYTMYGKKDELEDFDGVEKIEEVTLNNVVKDYKVKMAKVTTRDGGVISKIGEIQPTWGANIMNFQNYLYDNNFVIGKWYNLNGNDRPQVVNTETKIDLSKISRENVIEVDKFNTNLENWALLLSEEIPKIKRLAFDIEVQSSRNALPDPLKAEDIVTAIGFEGDDISKVFVLKRDDVETGELDPNVNYEFFDSEVDMIQESFKIIEKYAMVLTFNGDTFDMPYLYNRAMRLGITMTPLKMMKRNATLHKGIHLDLYQVFKNRSLKGYAFNSKYVDNSLDAISEALIGEKKIKYDGELNEIPLGLLGKYCLNDAHLTYKLTTYNGDLVMNLLVILSKIANMPIDDLSRRPISTWIRSMFYHQHKQNGDLIPRSTDFPDVESSTKATIKGKKYEGAIVQEPDAGIHFDVKVLDFASLYPSIIKVRNISYETVNCPHDECKSNIIPFTKHWACTKKSGIASILIGSLKELRVSHFKRLLREAKKSGDKDSEEKYDMIVQSLKVLLNASYGIIGDKSFDLYYLPTAESVTAIGRDIIITTVNFAKSNGMNVIYGDSVMPDTPITIRRKNGMIDIIPIETLMPKTVSGKHYDKFGDIDILSDKGFTKIKHVYRHKVKKNGYRILTRKGFVECTEDHSLVINGKETKPSTLKIGDKIDLINFKTKSITTLSDDLSWLFGFYIAEGTLGEYKYETGTKNSWRIVNQDKKLLEKSKKIIENILGIETTIIDIRESSATYGLVPKGNYKLLIDFFKHHCYRGDEKSIPQCVLNSQISSKESFINGMMDGDGSTDKFGIVIIDQIHKTVQSGIVSILEELDFEYSLQIRKDKPNVCRIRIIKNKNDKRVKKSDIIKKIEKFNIDGFVYDIETSNHHFCGGIGGVLLHNTDSIFVKNPTKEQIEMLIKYTSDNYAIDLEVDKEYRYCVLSNRKKNYFGVKLDGSVSITGLTGKKSHTPPFLKTLFNSILDELKTIERLEQFEPIKDKIRKMIKNQINTFESLILKDLVFNVKIGEEIANYKTKPQAVIAAEQLPEKPQMGQYIQFVKTWTEPHVKPVQLARRSEIDTPKYFEAIEKTLEQVTEPMDINLDLLFGRGRATSMDSFF